MTPAELLASLFPAGHQLRAGGAADDENLLFGTGTLTGGALVHVVGAVNGAPVGVDQALRLAAEVLAVAARDDGAPLLFLVDTASQRMSRRDELLGLSELLAHLAKSLRLADARGHRTVGLLYGGSAAGAFIATALACETLVALPGAHPAVMDLPSMARVTKLPLAVLEEKAKATPVFAPGLANLALTGAIAETWDGDAPLGPRLEALLARPAESADVRARLGRERGGRTRAEAIADEIVALAAAHAHG